MANNAVGSIYIGLHVDASRTRVLGTVADSVVRESNRMRSSLGGTSRSVTALRGQMSQNLRFRMLNDAVRQATLANNEFARLRATMMGVGALLGTSVTAAAGGTFLLSMADQSNRLNNQLRTVTQSEEDLVTTRRRLHDISQLTRSDMAATVTLFARNTRAARDFGATADDMFKVTEAIQKAFAIGGASQAEAMGAAIQLSQGIASNRFSGEEYRSVSENAPVLLQGMAKALDVSIGKLREMAHAGELTGETVVKAILGAKDAIDRDFNKTIPTLGQSLTRLNNSILQNIGNIDEDYGVTRKLSTAMSNLAENFEDVAQWAQIAALAMGSIFLGKLGAGATKGAWSSLIPNKAERAAINEQIAQIRSRRYALKREMVAMRSDIEGRAFIGPVQPGAARPDAFEMQRREAQAPIIGRAERAQGTALRAAADAENRRFDLARKLSEAQASVAGNLYKQVEAANASVARDAERLSIAQKAVAAERERLALLQAQKLAAADQSVSRLGAAATSAQGGVASAAANVEARRAEEIGALRDKIEKRHIAIVDEGLRLTEARRKVAVYQQLADTEGLTSKQQAAYQAQLRAQQKALIAQQKLRKEAEGFSEQIRAIEQGGTTRGIDTAMNAHAAAVRRAETATAALAKAEADRAKIASGIGGKGLDKRIATEARAMKAYQDSLDAATAKTAALNQVIAAGPKSSAISKLAAQVKRADADVVAAHARLAAASSAVDKAYVADSALVARAQQDRAAAATAYNDALTRHRILTDQAAMASKRLTVSVRALAAAQRVGGSILSFLGGWTGVAFIAAIAGIGMYEANVAKAAERTERLKRELNDLGLISDKVAGVAEKTAESFEALAADELRNKIRELREEMDRLRGEQNVLDAAFHFDPTVLGNMLKQIDFANRNVLRENFTVGSSLSPEDQASAAALREIVTAAQEGTDSAEGLITRLDKLTSSRALPAWMDNVASSLRQTIPLLDAMGKLTADLERKASSFGRSGNDMLGRVDARLEADMAANRQAAQSRDVLDSVQAEAVAAAQRSEIESRILKIMDDQRKAAESMAEDQGITLKMDEARLRANAEALVKIEDQAAAAKQIADFMTDASGMSLTLVDRDALTTVDDLFGQFETGLVDVETMQSRMEEIADLRLSDSMNGLIEKIIAAIPQLATLLGIAQSFPGVTPQGPTRGRGAVGRARRGLAAKTAIGTGVAADALADAGLSERDAYIKSTAEDLQAKATKAGGILPADQARETAAAMYELEQRTKAAGKAADDAADAAKKYSDGMADLQRNARASSLDEFLQQVLSSAEGLGISTDELDQFIATVSSEGLAAAPEKFRDIADALREVNAAKIIGDLQFETANLFASPADKAIAETLRGTGIEADSAYGKMIAGQIRFNQAVQDGRDFVIGFAQDFRQSWQQNYLNAIEEKAKAQEQYADDMLKEAMEDGALVTQKQREEIDKLAKSMADAKYGSDNLGIAMKSMWDALKSSARNALDSIASKLLEAGINGLFSGLTGAPQAGWGWGQPAAGGGNIFAQIFSALLGGTIGGGFGSIAGGAAIPMTGFTPGLTGPMLFDDGGFTGMGSRDQVAGLVHAGEYVFSAPAVAKMGKDRLEALHQSLKGYASGGYVRPSVGGLPALPAAANNNGPLVEFHITGSRQDAAEIARVASDTFEAKFGSRMRQYQQRGY